MVARGQGTLRLGRYRHYKGGLYEVLMTARHSETLEDMVVYRAVLDAASIWVRPLALFLEMVEVDGVRIPRFAYQPDDK